MLQLFLEEAEGIRNGNIQLPFKIGKYCDQWSAKKIQTNNKFSASFCLVLVSQNRSRMAVCFWGASSITDKFRVRRMILMSHLGLLLDFGVIL